VRTLQLLARKSDWQLYAATINVASFNGVANLYNVKLKTCVAQQKVCGWNMAKWDLGHIFLEGNDT
jgi:hypothetical protein